MSLAVPLSDGRVANVVFTGRSHGDMGSAGVASDVEQRRRSVVDLPWTVLHQVHGADVVVVDSPGQASGVDADAAVTARSGAPVSVLTADCAPIVLIAEAGAVAVVHAGWRGLLAGVLQASVSVVSALAPGPVRAEVGPCIGPECYEFSPNDLELLIERFGPSVESVTRAGTPALDLWAGVSVVLEQCGVEVPHDRPRCTACSQGWYSHRARGEPDRQAAVAWISPS